jgi:hypothetical protein
MHGRDPLIVLQQMSNSLVPINAAFVGCAAGC